MNLRPIYRTCAATLVLSLAMAATSQDKSVKTALKVMALARNM